MAAAGIGRHRDDVAAHLTADLGKLLRVHGRPPCKISFAQFDSIPKYGRKVNSFLRHIVADFRLFAYIGRGEGRGEAMLVLLPYDRAAAVRYAHLWAYGRNPRYYDYESIGGDCTNFASQCIYAAVWFLPCLALISLW